MMQNEIHSLTRVRFTQFDDWAFDVARETYPAEADPKDFERVYEGTYLGVIATIFGIKALIHCDDGKPRICAFEKLTILD